MIDFKKSAKTRILESIRALNPKNELTENDVVFLLPVPTTAHNRNTKVVVRPLDYTKHAGKRTLYYNRLPLERITTDLGVTGENLPLVNDTHALLPYLLSQFNLNLLPEDIVIAPLNGLPYTLTAATNSLGWTGSVTITSGMGPSYEVLALDDGSLFVTDDDSLILIDEN